MNSSQDDATEPRNELKSREQPVRQMQVIPQSKKTTESEDNSTELKALFQKNRSLRYLVGNDVLIRRNHNQDNYERHYHTIK